MASNEDAKVLLQCYDLRREAQMRTARDWVLSFQPRSYEELKEVATVFGADKNQHWRQVTSYWEMVFSLANHRALDASLLLDNCGEGLIIFARVKPHLEQLRKDAGSPRMFKQAEDFVNSSSASQDRFKFFEDRVRRMAAATQGK